jgi:tetratricopeptide (TPR) repeat protein
MSRLFASVFAHLVLISLLVFVGLTVSCSAQTEDQALASLRQLTQAGMPPTEDFLASIERRFAGRRAGSLAKLLHARMKLDSKDYAGAAALLNSDEFARTTKLGDYALWLRGQALQMSGNHAEAIKVFERLGREYPDSVRTTDAKLLWADSAIASGQAMMVPALLNDLNESNNPAALLRTAKSFEAQNDQQQAIKFYRRAYFYGPGSDAAKEAESKLTSLGQSLTPATAAEATVRAEKLYAAKSYAAAEKAYSDVAASFPASMTPAMNLKRLTALQNLRRGQDAAAPFNAIPASAKEKEEAYYQLALAYARARMWPQAKPTLEEKRQ